MEQNSSIEKPVDNSTAENRTPRHRTFKAAVASYNNRSISFDVVLKDLSDTGAKIKLSVDDMLPDHFTLFVELDGIVVDCEVVWRSGREIGAKFVSEIKRTTPLRQQTVQPTMADRKVLLRRKPIV